MVRIVVEVKIIIIQSFYPIAKTQYSLVVYLQILD